MPKRIQLSRKRGWRLPLNTIVVSRPSQWGNPFDWRKLQQLYDWDDWSSKLMAKCDFEEWLNGHIPNFEESRRQWILDHLHELANKDVACSCRLSEPCHGDILLKLANEISQK